MDIETAGKVAILYQNLEDLRHKQNRANFIAVYHAQEKSKAEDESTVFGIEIKKIEREIAELK